MALVTRLERKRFEKLKTKYLHMRNLAYLAGLMSEDLVAVIEEGLTNWDAQTEVPSKLLEALSKNAGTHSLQINRDMAGVIPVESGRGAKFVVAPHASHGPYTLFQILTEDPITGRESKLEFALKYILKGAKDLRETYSVYLHSLIASDGLAYVYYGITGRPPFLRFQEHWSSAKAGSHLLFHKKIREVYSSCKTVQHTVISSGLTREQALDTEEYLVSKYSLFPNHENGMNMIPGGLEGIRQMHKLGILKTKDTIEPDLRDKLIQEFLEHHPLKGIPNPLVAERWKDDAFAEAVICGGQNRLSADQVRQIRYLYIGGYSVENILDETGAINIAQVKNVLIGRTYSRIK